MGPGETPIDKGYGVSRDLSGVNEAVERSRISALAFRPCASWRSQSAWIRPTYRSRR